MICVAGMVAKQGGWERVTGATTTNDRVSLQEERPRRQGETHQGEQNAEWAAWRRRSTSDKRERTGAVVVGVRCLGNASTRGDTVHKRKAERTAAPTVRSTCGDAGNYQS